jgi:molybdate transport system substrate-binding protein
MMKRVVTTVLLLILAVRADAAVVRVSAAASLKDALDEICRIYARGHGGVTLLTNYGASGGLARQIESGAPADIYISANSGWVDYLKGKGTLDNASIAPLAANALVFAGREGRKVTGMADLPRLERIAVGSPASVPAGAYALAALRRAGIERLVESKLVMARDVRAALLYAERGEADGAFVYRTDLLLAKRAKLLFVVPAALYPPIVYPAALTMTGARDKDAVAFFRFLFTGEAQAVLKRYGFD